MNHLPNQEPNIETGTVSVESSPKKSHNEKHPYCSNKIIVTSPHSKHLMLTHEKISAKYDQ